MKFHSFLLIFLLFVTNAFAQRKPLPKTISAPLACDLTFSGCALIAGQTVSKTCNTNIVFTAPRDNSNCFIDDSQTNWGCMSSRPNQTWLYLTVTQGGSLSFTFYHTVPSTGDNYYDGVIWGPISGNNLSNACSATYTAPVSCDFDVQSQYYTTLSIPNAQVGEKYIMCLTNYGNISTEVTVNQPSGGAVEYCIIHPNTSCTLPTAAISGNQTIQSGQSANISLSFTGIGPWNYTLSNGQIGTASSSPHTVTVSPTQSTTYSLSSVSNSCGTGTVSGSATVTVISGNVDLENGLITCFPFSGNASDGRGKNDGTVYGATLTTDRFNRPNQAYNFDGINDFISFPSTNLNNNQFSYSVWVKPDSPPYEHEFIIENTQNIVYTDYYPNRGYGIWNYRSSQTGPATYSQTIPTDLTKWYHIVVTATANVIKLYIDGNFITSTTIGGTPAYTLSTAFIGKRFNDSFYFGGKIDDIRMYNRALNDSEVLALYSILPDDNCDTYVHTKTGLVSCYSFTNNSYDEIGYNNGTLNNVTLTTDRFGNQNSAYQFAGNTSSNINIPNTSQLLNNSYTYSAWINASSLPTIGGTAWIVGIGQGGVGDQALYIYNNNGVIGFSAHTYATPAGCLSNGLFSANGGVTVNANQWYHIAVTMGNGAYKMYVDSKLVSSATSSCITMIYGSSPLAHIGSRLGILSPFNGIIDDVRIYNRALTEDEILNINYTKGCRNKCLQTISLDTPYNNTYPQRKEAFSITASSLISSTSKMRLDGVNNILLLPGFKVDNGAVFEAINEGCGGNK